MEFCSKSLKWLRQLLRLQQTQEGDNNRSDKIGNKNVNRQGFVYFQPSLFGGAAVPIGGGGGGGFPLDVDGGADSFSPFLQDLFSNLAAAASMHQHPGASVHFVGGGGSPFLPPGGGVLYGNPGDYAWGRGGLDVIVTQLLNQMEGSGPPPLKGELIDEIPKVKVTQKHVGNYYKVL